jgi:hypothetical protein
MATPIYRQGEQGSRSTLNITAPTVIYAQQGQVFKVSILVSPTAAGGIYDAAATSGNTQANEVAPIPAGTVGLISMDGAWVFNGLLIDPGTGGAVSVWWSVMP